MRAMKAVKAGMRAHHPRKALRAKLESWYATGGSLTYEQSTVLDYVTMRPQMHAFTDTQLDIQVVLERLR